MNPFNRRTAQRIATVCLILAGIVTPLAWYIARERAEDSVVALAMEESRRLITHFDAAAANGPDAANNARKAAEAITGGLFDIAEIYDQQGRKLAEAFTPAGEKIEHALPKHGKPVYASASYESLHLADEQWALRVFIPLHADMSAPAASGYFEGVRIIPDWQRDDIQHAALSAALFACLAALLCGATIYPIVVRLSAENERKTREVLDSHISMMEALGRAIAKRDSDTGAHNYRVSWISARIGEEIGLAGAAMQSLIAGSFLHDVGKIGIPDAILLKPGRLTDEEMDTMRTHVALGEEIVTGMGWLEGAHEVVAGHHEKWDGSGYPRRLAGEAIPLSARIFAIADVFDALSSKRPYKEPLPHAEVMRILRESAGSHFDPAMLGVFERIVDEVRQALQDSSEAAARQLLESQIRKHFER